MRPATPFLRAFSSATLTASGSVSHASTRERGRSLAAAMASIPVPVPTSRKLPSRKWRSMAARHRRVVSYSAPRRRDDEAPAFRGAPALLPLREPVAPFHLARPHLAHVRRRQAIDAQGFEERRAHALDARRRVEVAGDRDELAPLARDLRPQRARLHQRVLDRLARAAVERHVKCEPLHK